MEPVLRLLLKKNCFSWLQEKVAEKLMLHDTLTRTWYAGSGVSYDEVHLHSTGQYHYKHLRFPTQCPGTRQMWFAIAPFPPQANQLYSISCCSEHWACDASSKTKSTTSISCGRISAGGVSFFMGANRFR